MKHLFSALIIISVFTSCRVAEQLPLESVETTTTIIDTGRVDLVSYTPQGTDSVVLSLGYSYFRGENLTVYQDSVNAHVLDFVVSNTEFETAGNRDLQRGKSFFLDQLRYFDSLSREDALALEEERLWDLQGHIGIIEFKDFVELELSIWTYTGGAHGNGYTGFLLIDHVTGKVLTLEDFVTSIPDFTRIAEKYFREQNNIEPESSLEELGYWFPEDQFYCNNNFYFTDDSMHFLYNIYEIAPYVGGSTEFSIPLSELKGFLRIQPNK